MKPAISPVWKQVSIFVYEGSGTSPKATVLNRRPSTNLNLFYTGLSITGSVNRAGTAKFTVVNTGSATDNERSLFTDDTSPQGISTTQKYVAIICGQDLIWSGKILRSVSATQPIYSSASTFCRWNVECESDIGKMKLQEVSPGAITGTVGEIVSEIVKNKGVGDIDWTGLISGSSPAVWDSVISNEGGIASYNILDSDMYSQFIALAKLSGFEWRTRLVNWVGEYTSLVLLDDTISISDTSILTRYTIPDIVGKWVLFLDSSGLGSSIVSFGKVDDDTQYLLDVDKVHDYDSEILYMTTNYWRGQQFVPTQAALGRVMVTLYKVGLPTGDLTVSIETDSSDYPSGVVLATSSIDAATIPSTAEKQEFFFDVPCTLTPSTKYWITLKGQAAWTDPKELSFPAREGAGVDYNAYGAGAWTGRSKVREFRIRTYYTDSGFSIKDVINPSLVPSNSYLVGISRVGQFGIDTYVWSMWGDCPALNSIFRFLSNVPSGVLANHNYYCVSIGDVFQFSDTLGGTPLTWSAPDGLMTTFAWVSFLPMRYMVLLNPVLDFSWDLEQETPVQTLNVNRTADSTNSLCYNYNDSTDKKQVATKVTVKGKNIDTTQSPTGKSESISTTLYAVNQWESQETMFYSSSIVTQKMDGYIHDCVALDPVLHLFGQDYALQVDDVFDVFAIFTDGTTELILNRVVTALSTTYAQPDGTKTTSVAFDGGVLSATKDLSPYSVFTPRKCYVQDRSRVYTGTIYFGGANIGGQAVYKTLTASGDDPSYGQYIEGKTSYGASIDDVKPIFPGCLASMHTGGEIPQHMSPQDLLGIISVTETVEQATTRGDLEVYATQALMNHSFYLRKGAFTCFINNFLKAGERCYGQVYDWQMIKEGDRIAVRPASTTNLVEKSFDGQYKYQWEVISWTLDCDSMIVSVELGDYEPNINTLISNKTISLDRTIS